jgi:hypothetical protein
MHTLLQRLRPGACLSRPKRGFLSVLLVFIPLAARLALAADPDQASLGDASNRILRLGQAMISAVDTRLAGRNAATDLALFSNTTGNWASAVFVPNASFWCQDIRAKLTGFHMYAGDWSQSYGLQMITPRHAISCGHNGPPPGKPLRYVSADGTVFETSISKWINDFPNAGSTSDTNRTFVTDLSVYLLADEAPAWVYKAPILGLTNQDREWLGPLDPPTVAVSQGSRTDGTPIQNTPNNRKLYVKSLILKSPRTALRDPFYHAVTVGDSGTPEFILVKDTPYLYRIITGSNGSGVLVADHVAYINSLIARADAAAGISTGYTVTLSQNPVP